MSRKFPCKDFTEVDLQQSIQTQCDMQESFMKQLWKLVNSLLLHIMALWLHRFSAQVLIVPLTPIQGPHVC